MSRRRYPVPRRGARDNPVPRLGARARLGRCCGAAVSRAPSAPALCATRAGASLWLAGKAAYPNGLAIDLPVTSRAADALDDLGLAQGPLSALHLPVASLDLGGYVLGRGLGVCSDLGEHDGLGVRRTSRRTSDVPDTTSDIISDITDMTSDVSDVIPAVSDVAPEPHVNGESHAVGLAKLLEEGVGDACVARGVPENVKAAARLLSEPNEVEHLEQRGIAWVRDAAAFDDVCGKSQASRV